jgi:succinate dehydrogenase/fumarate reductase flavoprotein subunit
MLKTEIMPPQTACWIGGANEIGGVAVAADFFAGKIVGQKHSFLLHFDELRTASIKDNSH